MDEKLEAIRAIFRDVLDDETLVVDAATTTQSCPAWDSVAMVQIILAVEARFGVRFTTAEVALVSCVADLLKKLS